MKHCPKCNYEIPDSIHFCPRCMYEYPKREVISKVKVDKKKPALVIALFIVAIIIIILTVIFIKGKINTEHKGEENVAVSQNQSIEDVPFIERLKYDYRNSLKKFEEVKDTFGEETDSTYWEEKKECTVYTFDNTMVCVNEAGYISEISVSYTMYGNSEGRGIFGIDDKSDKEEVLAVLGIPDEKIEEDEWYYLIEDKSNTALIIYFDRDKQVANLNYLKKYIDQETRKVPYSATVNTFDGTIEDIPYNDSFTYDLRDYLVRYEDVKKDFGEETDTVLLPDNKTAHEHGIITAYVNEEGSITNLLVHYMNGMNPNNCGILGIGNQTTKEEVLSILGEPNSRYGADEWVYFITKEGEVPNLVLYFGEDSLVEEFEYYNVSKD